MSETTTTRPVVLPAQPPKRATCKRCGKGGLTWKKSKADRWYLSEEYLKKSAYGRYFRNQRLHKCATAALTDAFNTRPQERPLLVVGRPHIAPADCGSNHRWARWQAAPGSDVWGAYCLGCGSTMVD
jgi:hypothetical protein